MLLFPALREAGYYLAERGRNECMACVTGLKDFYCISYPQLWDDAINMEKVFVTVSSAGPLGK